jgi:hypothetical protein
MTIRAVPTVCCALLLSLAACDQAADQAADPVAPEGTSISIVADSKEKAGVFTANADGKTGEVSVAFPGFEAKVELPKINLDDTNFDLDGVKLYPGSRVKTVNVKAAEGSKGDQATVNVVFEAKDAPKAVADWYAAELARNKADFARSGNSLSGHTRDNDAFAIKLASAPDGTLGVISVRE